MAHLVVPESLLSGTQDGGVACCMWYSGVKQNPPARDCWQISVNYAGSAAGVRPVLHHSSKATRAIQPNALKAIL
ncbi:hypothetical protein C1N72_23555 (plasmid) [Pantoea ananatis]